MKLKELVEQYGEYTVPQELIDKLEKPKPNAVWDLQENDTYFCVNSSQANWFKSMWTNGKIDKNRLEMGALFLTPEEAEKDVERRKIETLLLKHGGRRWFESDKSNYILYLDTYDDEIDYMWVGEHRYQGTIYFASEDEIIRAIGEIGEERIKKALFEER